MNPVKSLTTAASNRSEIRAIDGRAAANDVELLAQIGYKQELNRKYSTLQVCGIAVSIMGLIPSVSSTLSIGLESGASGFVWGWFCAGFFILCTATSLTILGSAIPTSGGLYYYTNYYAPSSIGVPLSFLIGCANSVGLCGAICSIGYGFASELLSAVFISYDGDFTVTNSRIYGVFAASVVTTLLICSLTTQHVAKLQTISIITNIFLLVLFFISVPIGVSKNSAFNDGHFIFGKLENFLTWDQGWTFMLCWVPAIWSIGAFDAVIHCSEEAKDAQRAIPFGILYSTFFSLIGGWAVCILTVACIKDGDTLRVLETKSGNPMAQIIYDALGKKWAVAFMALICVGQYLMLCSILIAASRQIWAFARDDGLPLHSYIKYVNPRVKVPVRATFFAGVCALLLGLLTLIPGSAGSGALFSLGVASTMLAWCVPILMAFLPTGRSRFKPGKFSLGFYGNNTVHFIAICWLTYVIVMSMFPNSKKVDKESMNYTVVINMGVWTLSIIYYFVYAHKTYHGPRSNLDEGDQVQIIHDQTENSLEKTSLHETK
ncbi:amino acid transporter [Suhomyces tanzawaensis NRRL Y-17324]|uniref:Amino acid transporter n=1 Tax=Suhomyces tanzawaensis NRRL Y-17324 TaxID=984487 RepID=A0A1E4SKM6_9ASCO|nr:amino acid transporter [Suhomyces tanzawaensis NRRL Y-17324]ODV80040.1 amino acid transporter [Suhomyces tanzawaensis NRRL Y-17324]